MIKEKLLKEKAKLEKLKESYEAKILEIQNDISEIDEFLNFKNTEEKDTTIEQTVMICIYPETEANAPHIDNAIWYPIYRNPNTTSDLEELSKKSKMIVANDSKNEADFNMLSNIAKHYDIKMIGEKNGNSL